MRNGGSAAEGRGEKRAMSAIAVNRAVRVLLVEDNPGDAFIIQERVEEEKYRPVSMTVASSLAEALSRLKAESFDLILLDLGLPDSMGLETFESMQAAAAGIPVLILTGDDDLSLAAICIERGAQDYLIKGRVEKFIATAIHNSFARAESRRALEASQAQFRRLFEAMAQGVLYQDQDGRITEANAAAEKILGLPLAKLQGRASIDPSWKTVREDGSHFPGEDHYSMVALRSGEPSAGMMGVFNPAEKDYRWLNVYAVPEFRDHEEKPYRVFTTFEDNTDLLRARQEVRRERDRARLYIDMAKVILMVLNLEGTVLLINKEGCRVLGYEEREIIGKNWFDNFVPARVREEILPLSRSLVGGDIETHAHHENTVLTRGGEERLVAWNNTVLRDEKGEITGLLSSGEDITEKRAAEEERNKLQASLAQSDRLASMGMLAAGVAHEINNPLSYVLYNIESLTKALPRQGDSLRRHRQALEKHLGPETLKELAGEGGNAPNPMLIDDMCTQLDSTLSGALKIRDIVKGLGTFSRVEDAQPMPVNVTKVIEAASSMAQNEIKYRARLVKDLGKVPAVLASEGRLSQVVLNLLINAAHAIEEGDAENNEIRIRTWSDGKEAFIEIKDTGVGIAPEDQKKLFEPFYTTKEIGMGSGLGLAISRNIVEGFGGRIEVQSAVGKGSRFAVSLPVLKVEAAKTPESSTNSDNPQEVRGRILLVDDEAPLRLAMTRMLRGHEVIAAGGEEALEILKRDQAFDIIICDMMMPRVTGMDLHQWLASVNPHLAEQLIFITGGAFTPNARKYLNATDNLRLEKPFDVKNFIRLACERIILSRKNRE